MLTGVESLEAEGIPPDGSSSQKRSEARSICAVPATMVAFAPACTMGDKGMFGKTTCEPFICATTTPSTRKMAVEEDTSTRSLLKAVMADEVAKLVAEARAVAYAAEWYARSRQLTMDFAVGREGGEPE